MWILNITLQHFHISCLQTPSPRTPSWRPPCPGPPRRPGSGPPRGHTDNKIFSCSSYNSSSSLVKLFSNFPRESSWHDDRKDILPKFLLKPTESDEKFAESAKEINYWHRELWLIPPPRWHNQESVFNISSAAVSCYKRFLTFRYYVFRCNPQTLFYFKLKYPVQYANDLYEIFYVPNNK